MKKSFVFVTVLLLVGLMTGCADKTKTLKPLATTLADKLGRTPANMVVEFQGCGATVCHYDVYFTTPDDFAALNSQIKRVTGELGISAPDGTEHVANDDIVNDMNSDLSTTSIKGRLKIAAGVYQQLPSSMWTIANNHGQRVATITLFWIRDSGITYEFDGKTFNSNMLLVSTNVDLNQPR